MKKTLISAYLLACSSLFTVSSYGSDEEFKNNFYFGVSGGLSKSAKTKFTHKETDLKVNFKSSKTYSAKIGYRLEQGLSVEIAGYYHPKFPIKSYHPNSIKDLKVPSETKVKLLTLNVLYDLVETKFATPYVLIGAGVGEYSVKPFKLHAEQNNQLMILETFPRKSRVPAFQLGLGAHKNLTNNIRFDVLGSLQVLKNVKVKYNKFEKIENGVPVYSGQKFLKQTMGKFTILAGLTIDL